MLISGKKKSVAGFFHFPANPELKKFFEKENIAYFDYGEISDENGHRPVLAAMSKIAGELAILEGSHYFRFPPGRGIMPSDARVTIVGAGAAGMAAAETALGLVVKNIIIFDSNINRFSISSRFKIKYALAENIIEVLPQTDLLIGAVAVKGGPAPKVFTKAMIRSMPKGSVFVDIAIDEGGCSETSQRPTTHKNPFFISEGVIHICITNLPGDVPKTASQVLSKALLPHLIKYKKLEIVPA